MESFSDQFFSKTIEHRQKAASDGLLEMAKQIRIGGDISKVVGEVTKALDQIQGLQRLSGQFADLGLPAIPRSHYLPDSGVLAESVEIPSTKKVVPDSRDDDSWEREVAGSKEGAWDNEKLLIAARSLSESGPVGDFQGDRSEQLAALEFIGNPRKYIVHDSPAMVIINKPAKIPSTDSPVGVMEVVKEYYDLGASLVEKVDTEMSGLLFVGKVPRFTSDIRRQFTDLRGQGVRRYFLALLDGEVKSEGPINCKVSSNPNDPRSMDFLPLAVMQDGEGKPSTFIQAEFTVGNSDMIKAMVAERLGAPIVGDKTRGVAGANRLMLHAVYAEFMHPFKRQSFSVGAPVPDDFRQVIGSLSVKEAFTENTKSSVLARSHPVKLF